jgi:hypothetical protein
LSAPTDISERFQRLYGEIFSLLGTELQSVGFVGPISIDCFVYRTEQGESRLKPVVEINPRYTMGRVTVELMKHACPGSTGVFRLVNLAQARAEGFVDFASYAGALGERRPLRFEGEPGGTPGETAGGDARATWERAGRIRQGALCLNDPGQAQVCLAILEIGLTLSLPGPLGRAGHPNSD